MKKQSNRKLTVHRETLRRLNPETLDQVAGGGPTTGCTGTAVCTATCTDTCNNC